MDRGRAPHGIGHLMILETWRYPKMIMFHPQDFKKGVKMHGGTSISPNIEGVPSPGLQTG